jgi:hypothetical protein
MTRERDKRQHFAHQIGEKGAAEHFAHWRGGKERGTYRVHPWEDGYGASCEEEQSSRWFCGRPPPPRQGPEGRRPLALAYYRIRLAQKKPGREASCGGSAAPYFIKLLGNLPVPDYSQSRLGWATVGSKMTQRAEAGGTKGFVGLVGTRPIR